MSDDDLKRLAQQLHEIAEIAATRPGQSGVLEFGARASLAEIRAEMARRGIE